MNEPKHTPGPWRYGHNKQWGSVGKSARLVDAPGWFIGPAEGIDIASVHLTASQDAAVQEANARLIATAPDMLATLEGILCYVEDGNVVELRPCGFVEEVRAVIAKATGN